MNYFLLVLNLFIFFNQIASGEEEELGSVTSDGIPEERSLLPDVGTSNSSSTETSINSSSTETYNNNTNSTEVQNEGPTMSPQLAFLMEASKLGTFQAGLMIQRYCLPVIIILGLIGNTISLVVMLQPQNRRISCCVYMAGLAISDNGALIVMAAFWIVTDGYPTKWTDATCIAWVYFVFLTTCCSAFILVVVTADRCLAIRWPLKARMWCTASKARKVLLLTVSFVALAYTPLAMMSGVAEGNICAAFAQKTTLSLVLSYVNLVLIPVIPFTLILIMNIIIIKAVRASGHIKATKAKYVEKSSTTSSSSEDVANEKKKDVSDATSRDEDKMNARNRQLTIMLLVVSITYLVIMLPISTRVVTYLFVDFTASVAHYAMYVLLYNAVNNLLFLNNAINFYLYCIAGAKFREDLKKVFCGK